MPHVLLPFLFAAALWQATPGAVPQNTSQPQPQAVAQQAATPPDPAARLVTVKRIYVDSFGDDPIARQVQAMVINSLAESKRFVVTENKDKSDAALKGTAIEKTSQEQHAYSEGTAVAGVGGSASGGTAAVSGHSAAIKDSSFSTETINDARVSVRLVGQDGDVIWTSTQESKGAKYKGATADVAEKIVKQLLRDVERAEKKLAEKP